MKEKHSDWLPGFDKKFADLTHDMVNDLEKCLQCGKCTAQCPAAAVSSYNPRMIMRDIRVGNIERIIASRELWMCFFCGGCYAVCPRSINIPYAVVMLRYAALVEGYGVSDVQRIRHPYANDYMKTGLSVSDQERNPTVRKQVARNSGTNGKISSIRKKMGMPKQRVVSEKALAEIKFISDATGMAAYFEKMENACDKKRSWNYGNAQDLVTIKRNADGKFVDLMDAG